MSRKRVERAPRVVVASDTSGSATQRSGRRPQHHRHLAGRETMSLVTIVIVLVVVGLVLWLINTYIPMQSTIKTILNLVVVIVVILWLLQVFGVIGSVGGVRVGT